MQTGGNWQSIPDCIRVWFYLADEKMSPLAEPYMEIATKIGMA